MQMGSDGLDYSRSASLLMVSGERKSKTPVPLKTIEQTRAGQRN